MWTDPPMAVRVSVEYFPLGHWLHDNIFSQKTMANSPTHSPFHAADGIAESRLIHSPFHIADDAAESWLSGVVRHHETSIIQFGVRFGGLIEPPSQVQIRISLKIQTYRQKASGCETVAPEVKISWGLSLSMVDKAVANVYNNPNIRVEGGGAVVEPGPGAYRLLLLADGDRHRLLLRQHAHHRHRYQGLVSLKKGDTFTTKCFIHTF